MKSMYCLALSLLFLWAGPLAGEEPIRILAMEIPGIEVPAKNTLWVKLSQLQVLSTELTADVPSAVIQLLNSQDVVLATFGSAKKGKIKWDHKTLGDKFLSVAFAAADYDLLAASIKAKTARPGLQLAACDGKTRSVIRSCAVTCCDFPDLVVQLNYPVNAVPGQSLRKEVTVTLENKGSIPAEDIKLEIVFSGDNQIPLRHALASTAFSEDMLLENGLVTIPLLEPGPQITVSFSGDLKLPEDAPPGKRYLGVVADPENTIGELNEDNNISSGYIMISAPEPAAFVVEMPETVLRFEPATYGFKIECLGTSLSDGKDWKLCKMKPNVYQFKHVSWSDFFWEIDTYERAVWEIRGADFCKKGGKAHDLGIKVEVAGGSLLIPPSHFVLKLARTRLRYEPASKKFVLLAYEKPICHLPFWWVCKREAHLYQIRYILWENFFWQVDTFKKESMRVSGGKFCSQEGNPEKLSLAVTVEK